MAPMSRQLMLRREMEWEEEEEEEEEQDDVFPGAGSGGESRGGERRLHKDRHTEQMYQRHFDKMKKMERMRQRLTEETLTDPETGKPYFCPEV